MYWITGILGILFISVPLFLGYTNNGPALWTSVAAGGIIIVMSGLEFLRKDRETWEYWVVGISGLLAIFAPFALGFYVNQLELWTTLSLGAMVALVAGSKIYVSKPKV